MRLGFTVVGGVIAVQDDDEEDDPDEDEDEDEDEDSSGWSD